MGFGPDVTLSVGYGPNHGLELIPTVVMVLENKYVIIFIDLVIFEKKVAIFIFIDICTRHRKISKKLF